MTFHTIPCENLSDLSTPVYCQYETRDCRKDYYCQYLLSIMANPDDYARIAASEESIKRCRKIRDAFDLTTTEFIDNMIELALENTGSEDLYSISNEMDIDDAESMDDDELRQCIIGY